MTDKHLEKIGDTTVMSDTVGREHLALAERRLRAAVEDAIAEVVEVHLPDPDLDSTLNPSSLPAARQRTARARYAATMGLVPVR